ncbi:MAG: hypothetical protein AAF596_05420 [Planctomycetota bacterium]
MNTEPVELRIARSPRGEAVRRAARLIEQKHGESVGPTEVTRDEAFAEFAGIDPASNATPPSAGAGQQRELVRRVSTQLDQLNAQRERLAQLLADLEADDAAGG